MSVIPAVIYRDTRYIRPKTSEYSSRAAAPRSGNTISKARDERGRLKCSGQVAVKRKISGRETATDKGSREDFGEEQRSPQPFATHISNRLNKIGRSVCNATIRKSFLFSTLILASQRNPSYEPSGVLQLRRQSFPCSSYFPGFNVRYLLELASASPVPEPILRVSQKL